MTLPPSSTSLLLPTRNPTCRAWLPQALYLAMPFCFSSAGMASHFVGSAWSNNRNCAIALSFLLKSLSFYNRFGSVDIFEGSSLLHKVSSVVVMQSSPRRGTSDGDRDRDRL